MFCRRQRLEYGHAIGGVVTIPVSLSSGPLENRVDLLPDSQARVVVGHPQGLQHGHDVRLRDLVDALVADERVGVAGEGLLPFDRLFGAGPCGNGGARCTMWRRRRMSGAHRRARVRPWPSAVFPASSNPPRATGLCRGRPSPAGPASAVPANRFADRRSPPYSRRECGPS